MAGEPIVPDEIIMNKIYYIRGKKVMLDSDLAELYGVETKRLNEQVARNTDRVPEDFMFRLNDIEFESLMSQIATSKRGGRRRRYLGALIFTSNKYISPRPDELGSMRLHPACWQV